MSKSEIEKIKAVLSEINEASKHLENDFLIKTLTKALEIAVDTLHAGSSLYVDGGIYGQSLKQISEILEVK